MNKRSIETAKDAIGILDLAGKYTELRREGTSEYSGPCPRCGGRDRFHINEDTNGFFCRQCRPLDGRGWGDTIEFLQWVGAAATFQDAVRMLAGGVDVPASPVGHRAARQAARAARAPIDMAKRAEVARGRLSSPSGDAVRDYLFGRGLTERAWAAMQYGATYDGRYGSGVTIPWIDESGAVHAINRRWIAPPADADKNRFVKGSTTAGRVYGRHLLSGRDVLMIVEGEINAASIWQECGEWMDVISLGSESKSLPEDAARLAMGYGYVFTWFDKAEFGARVAAQAGARMAMHSTVGQDANDYLQRGVLGPLLRAWVDGHVGQ